MVKAGVARFGRDRGDAGAGRGGIDAPLACRGSHRDLDDQGDMMLAFSNQLLRTCQDSLLACVPSSACLEKLPTEVVWMGREQTTALSRQAPVKGLRKTVEMVNLNMFCSAPVHAGGTVFSSPAWSYTVGVRASLSLLLHQKRPWRTRGGHGALLFNNANHQLACAAALMHQGMHTTVLARVQNTSSIPPSLCDCICETFYSLSTRRAPLQRWIHTDLTLTPLMCKATSLARPTHEVLSTMEVRIRGICGAWERSRSFECVQGAIEAAFPAFLLT